MAEVFVTSDSHFGHRNIVQKFDPPRPFNDEHHMNEMLVQNWNSVVKPGDKVYHLGDVFFGDKENFARLWPRLNGKKRLIVGNHDDVKFLARGAFFEKVMMWRWFDDFLFTHVPVHPSSLREARGGAVATINVHGHTHFRGSPVGPYVSVCVELTNYTPINVKNLKHLHQAQQREWYGRED